ncbi:PAS domain-containing protein [Aquibacillus sp. 3ASR75-54]|uniref:PAS domain-containing protein n=1 Tax=Aquibacillus salsiterrae TaxID=2950439 RepID=A0A9X4AFC4_9BACI|nr:PAS domain-containing protein [Aquibacillus salsiterrae]
MVTDKQGKIITVNPAFTKLTGYSTEEAIGKNPNMLSSGKQSNEFYEKMWQTLHANHPCNKR